MISYLASIGIMFCVYAILALGLTVQYGLTGLINFGHVAFFAVPTRQQSPPDLDWVNGSC
jgi:branched-chain amino acid transport system permease protein